LRDLLHRDHTVPVLVLKGASAVEAHLAKSLLRALTERADADIVVVRHMQTSQDLSRLVPAILQADAAVVFLGSGQRPGDPAPLFTQLYEEAERAGRTVMLVPTMPIWDKFPRSMKQWRELRKPKSAPGDLRRIYRLLVSPHKRTALEMGEPIPLSGYFLRKESPKEVELRIRLHLFRSLLRLERAVVGPPLRDRNRTVNRVLKDRRLLEQIEELAAGDPEKRAALVAQARKILFELAADFRQSTIIRFRRTLDWAWPKVIEGFWVDEPGLEKYREISRKAPALVLPCHRSHADYLLVSYLFNHYNLMIPYIAAGINLSFWPMGPIFRHSGAYFIRRSFKGDRLYPLVLDAYVRRLLKDHIPQEFFPEGTRSRTGKLLHPKTGLLAINLRAVQRGDVPDLAIAPVSIVYGRLFESSSYLREAEGAGKQKESAAAVLKTTRLLGKNFGKVYLNFAPPFLLSEYLADHNVKLETLDDTAFRELTTSLGYHVIREIQRATLVTPIALLALLFLSNIRRGMRKDGLLRRARYALAYLNSRGARLAEFSEDPEPAILDFLDRLVRAERIESIQLEGDTVFRAVEQHRNDLEYYKNNIVHLFVYVSFAAISLLMEKRESVSLENVRYHYEFLRHLFFKEFIYDTTDPSPEELDRELNALCEFGLITRAGDMIRIESGGTFILRNIASLLLSYLEAYATVLDSYTAIARSDDTPPPNIIPSIISRGKLLYTMGDITRRESINKFYYQTGHQWMNVSGLVNWPVLFEALRKREENDAVTAYRNLKDRVKQALSAIYGP